MNLLMEQILHDGIEIGLRLDQESISKEVLEELFNKYKSK